jgi:hypothetical protein
MCLQLDHNLMHLKKYVSQAWADSLNPEALAYWYMDDGTMSPNQIIISTHAFSEGEIDRLIARLAVFGIHSKKGPVNQNGKVYTTLRMNREEALKFLKLTLPFAHPSMLYKFKLALLERPTVTCSHCGQEMRHKLYRSPRHFCKNKECQLAQHREASHKYSAKNRQKIRARQQSNYHANLAESRRKSRELAQKLRQDPISCEHIKAQKRAWRARMKGDPLYQAKLKEERQRYYQRVKANPARLQARRMKANARRRKENTPPLEWAQHLQLQRARRQKCLATSLPPTS